MPNPQTLRNHDKLILDMVWDKEKVYLFTGGVDMKVRSWMAEIGSECKVFEGATRSVCVLLVRGDIRKFSSWCMMTFVRVHKHS